MSLTDTSLNANAAISMSDGSSHSNSFNHYPPAKQAPEGKLYRPGDIGLCRASDTKGKNGATTTIGKFIQASERSEFGDTDFARWTHSFIVVSEQGHIVEWTENGCQENHIEKYFEADYFVVNTGLTQRQRKLAVECARSYLGNGYGFVNFASLAQKTLGYRKLNFYIEGQFVCSGGVSICIEKGEVRLPKSIYRMEPANLAYFYGVQTGEVLPPMNWLDRFLNNLVLFADLFRHRL